MRNRGILSFYASIGVLCACSGNASLGGGAGSVGGQSTSTGGAVSTGGAISTGGAPATGGVAAASGGSSAGTPCGSAVCGSSEYCCNASCSICASINGGGCITMECSGTGGRSSTGGAAATGGASATGGAPATGGVAAASGGSSAGTPCGSAVCGTSEYCCNASCSICATINGGGCIDMICSGTGGSSSTGGAAGTGGASSITGLHSSCVNGACASTLLTPVTYYGMAGTAGPPLCNCEIPCSTTACPSTMRCGSVSDGPSNICMYTNASGATIWP